MTRCAAYIRGTRCEREATKVIVDTRTGETKERCGTCAKKYARLAPMFEVRSR